MQSRPLCRQVLQSPTRAPHFLKSIFDWLTDSYNVLRAPRPCGGLASVKLDDSMERRSLLGSVEYRRMASSVSTSSGGGEDVNPLLVGAADRLDSPSPLPPSALADGVDGREGGSSSSESRRVVFTTIDAVLSSADAEPFRQRLLAALFLANACDAVEVLSIGFILTVYTNGAGGAGLSAAQEEVLTAAVFAGMLLGGLASGSASDRLGRRGALLGSLATNACAALASALAPSPAVLIACRVVCGLGVGASVPAVFTMASEMFPPQRRGEFVTVR